MRNLRPYWNCMTWRRLASVKVSLQVVLERSDVGCACLFADEIWLVSNIRTKDTFGNDSDDVFVWTGTSVSGYNGWNTISHVTHLIQFDCVHPENRSISQYSHRTRIVVSVFHGRWVAITSCIVHPSLRTSMIRSWKLFVTTSRTAWPKHVSRGRRSQLLSNQRAKTNSAKRISTRTGKRATIKETTLVEQLALSPCAQQFQETRTCHLTTWHCHTRKSVLWIPLDSHVENNTSAKRKRSTPTVIKFSFGSTWVLPLSEPSAVDESSVAKLKKGSNVFSMTWGTRGNSNQGQVTLCSRFSWEIRICSWTGCLDARDELISRVTQLIQTLIR